LKSNYEKFPVHPIEVSGEPCVEGWHDILDRLTKGHAKSKIVIECYQGIHEEEFFQHFKDLPETLVVKASEVYQKPENIRKLVYPDVTDDRIFGKWTNLNIDDFFDEASLKKVQSEISNSGQSVLVYGTGASLICQDWDVLVYADMARWEIQQRMRANQVNNLGVENKEEEFSLKYKQGYFVDWRICDRIKINLLSKVDYLLDTNEPGKPKLITGNTLRNGLEKLAARPFRLVPFFDPGPWGGQWMKEVCDLDRSATNYAWCFDCVPEENSLLLGIGDSTVEIPSVNLLFLQGEKVLGKDLHDVMGPEFPIRFDFLDTMEGGNLSLQVHPSVAYIREQFGISYTQDESYYMLDAGDDAEVYLGLREDINPGEMIRELKDAQEGKSAFDAEKHVQTWKVKKHDHVLIPAGTVHCSGANSMVLEISATPYIFTFKLWDWGRLGLDGKPRPINIAHGEKVIEWDRKTSWTKENLVNQIRLIKEGDGWKEEQTGLHELEFIETRRHWFEKKVSHHTEGKVNVLNLVEGREVIVESPSGAFDPFVIHYAETFVVPASVGAYTIRPYGESEGKTCGTIKAYVRMETLRELGDDLSLVNGRNFY
jgi:mannose-6-phosphate isomerase class I